MKRQARKRFAKAIWSSAVVRLNENEPGRKTQRYFARTNDGKLLLRKVLGATSAPR